MTTLESFRYDGMAELMKRLDGVRTRRFWIRTLTGFSCAMTLGFSGVLLAALGGYWPGQPPAIFRWLLLIVLLLAAVSAMAVVVQRLAFGKLNPAQAARYIETHVPQVRNGLINSLQLCDDPHASPQLVQFAIQETLHKVNHYDLRQSVSLRHLKRWAIAAGIAMLLLAGFILLQPGVVYRGLVAATQPHGFVPVINAYPLESITPGDTKVFAGEPVIVRVLVKNPQQHALKAELILDGQANPLPMFPAELEAGRPSETISAFLLRLPAVHETTRYFVRIQGPAGESRFPADRQWYHIALSDLNVTSFAVAYSYPAYTGMKRQTETLTANAAMLEAPQGSKGKLTIRLGDPVPAGCIEYRNGLRKKLHRDAAGRAFSTELSFQKTDAFRLIFFNAAGKVLKQIPNGRSEESAAAATMGFVAPQDGYIPLRVIPDRKPTIEILSPNRNLTWPPSKPLQLKLRAGDDHGLTAISLWVAKHGQEPKPLKVFSHPELTGKHKKQITFSYSWSFSEYKPGDVIEYFAAAIDNRHLSKQPGKQTQRSPKFKIVFRRAEQVAQAKAQLFAILQKKLMALLELQVKLRVDTSIAWKKHKTLAMLQETGSNIFAGQQSIRRQLQSLEKHFPFPPELDDMKKAIAMLCKNEASLAVDQSQVLSTLAKLAARDRSCRLLADTQDTMIGVLQDFLAIMPTLAANSQDVKQPGGDDLTADQRKKLRDEFKDQLKKFIEEQKKAIAASERLNKKALDDFTPEDEKLLKDLEALEDKWEKFLNESFTDFSKLAQQDFSTPAMLKELMAVKCDITMAKDALQKKATEIATASESNGIENAETLTANLEKWLPDTPDRTKWNMEAPTEQDNIEQAELPTELEDLIGDLLEEEEDLFEEMDDMSSKATSSMDKGAGWDALDGPISSMNAQGVTGNQLPNTSEIQGRSGEGRSGKSAGEFVEDKAVGKGGRRTPTRMSDDPFQKGQINDQSKDPPGGATGGGKHSGQGEEGLEGPTPAEVQQQLKRLAGQQASLVNRAERIQTQFKTGDYSSFRLQQAVTLMNRVKGDLQKGHYQNAMRRRKATIDALKQARQMIGTKIEVQADSSQAMPKHIRDKMSNTAGGNLPPEYKDILQQYYKRLSEQQK